MTFEVNSSNLERVFTLLQNDWVWNFFFESDKEELDMLQYALRDVCPAAVERRVYTQYGLDDLESPFAFDERFVSFFLPSFSTGDVTVGFAINECLRKSSPLEQRPRYLTRVVRDDVAGTQLSIHISLEKELVEVWFHRLNSRTCREYVFATFSLPLFRSAMRKLMTNPPLLEAIVYSYRAFETRTCPDCLRPPKSKLCACQSVLPRKLHPRDAVADTNRLALFCGGYQATGIVQLWKQGSPTIHARFRGGAIGIMTNNPSLEKELGNWALQMAANRRRVSPAPGTQLPVSAASGIFEYNIASNIWTKEFNSSQQESERGVQLEQQDSWNGEIIDRKQDSIDENNNNVIAFASRGQFKASENHREATLGIAPRPFLMNTVAADTMNSSVVDEQLRKLELRKARNRESAYRSNLRKKRALEQLRKDLETAVERKKLLTETEQRLRKENLGLRKQIKEKK